MARPTTSARLRRTFHYPSDDNDDASPSSTPEVLDEQEQESLIATLAAQNTTRNAAFHRLLYLLPALSTIPFLLTLLLPPATSAGCSRLLLPLLGMSSLLATTATLYQLDVTETGFPLLDQRRRNAAPDVTSPPSSSLYSGSRSRWRRRSTGMGMGMGMTRRNTGLLGGGEEDSKSPLERHLPWLNVGLAALALLTGFLEERARMMREGGGVSPLLLGALPGVVYAVIVGAKVVMAGVDPEGELGKLKYGFKGA